MRRPKGIKTKKSVSKRFKITGTGKVMRMRAGKRHLLSSKNANELSSPEGKTALMGELVAQAKEAVTEPASQEGIETVHFSAFVIQ